MSNKVKSKSFRGNINSKDRVLNIINREALNEFLETLEGEVEITISEVQSRTHFQNNYYWKVVIGTLIENEPMIGHTKDEMHQVLKAHFNVKSTSKLNTYEFTEFIDRVVRWSAQQGVRIPDPDDKVI